MQELCFLTNVSGEQWAAWVQAVGSVAALAIAIWLPARDARRKDAEESQEVYTRQILWRRTFLAIVRDTKDFAQFAYEWVQHGTLLERLDPEIVTDLRARLRNLDNPVPDFEAEHLMQLLRSLITVTASLHRIQAKTAPALFFTHLAEVIDKIKEVEQQAMDGLQQIVGTPPEA